LYYVAPRRRILSPCPGGRCRNTHPALVAIRLALATATRYKSERRGTFLNTLYLIGPFLPSVNEIT
jgi:hypothetical protein